MFISKLSTALALTALASFATLARTDQPPLVTPLMTKALADIPGKEVEMLLIEYPPDGVDPPHRHDAHGFIYVIEGTIIMQVKGGKRTVVRAGETFYEGPEDVHLVGQNASRVLPAKFVAVLVKRVGVPAVLPPQ
jgi:quercetin dioxygenase-like cupin family protein